MVARADATPGRLVHDADATAKVTVGGEVIAIIGRAARDAHVGRRRVPTLHWIWAPWLGDGSLEVTAVSLRDRFALGFATCGSRPARAHRPRPATAAHPHGLVTATVAGPRRLVHARAWAEPSAMVGYAYRDTDDRDLMIAQSDIGSAHYEVRAHSARRAMEAGRRAPDDGGVAVEIHQRMPLPDVNYLAWDDTTRHAAPDRCRGSTAAISRVAAGDRDRRARADLRRSVRETGQKIEPGHRRSVHQARCARSCHGDAQRAVPTTRRAPRRARRRSSPASTQQLAERIPWCPP